MGDQPTLSVLGAGSWGTALAALTARNGVPTRLWGRDAAALAALAASRRNQRYLPDLELPAGLAYESDLAAALRGADIVLIVVPSHAFAETLDAIAPLLPPQAAIAWASKGFEPGTGRFLHELVAEKLPGRPAAVVTGPSFAKEVAAGLPSAVTVHSEDEAFATRLCKLLHAPNFRAYSGTDVLGAELGGAMKNVLAVATGVADGMQLGLNARAGLITRGMNEMLRLGKALGARPETLMGLAGLGDLVLTCTGDLSRNRRLGLALGRGVALDEAVRQIGQVVESVLTADEVMRLARKHGLDLPISAGVQAVLHGEVTPVEGLRTLMAREQKPEYPEGLFGPF
ncbi:NAD(P)H-dependent glycerol-3-phosphate dehydrogenase [Fulvimonas soli]|jgi:glycerol-3-phosphate dehydrogenase (NAD(P)+)|uniref:Glycerol-3-phosphate dehydrogenase [NAD(P)+] n=1 Tax=Fulvimonas soli TaxID=155197 RepID=A0A316HIY3_9GAMM|nr:NAD(P)H-dependent glycerol-3-phosphate dehydrogenase [Fulvimonas soli]PWK81206.1 glycerol 3-phosphate dehydrogenase (NAD(P)+) [Fulvimonas soli]TNY25530.1 glycerol-3-phosphate dehydrogenase [Fulvimonas soli]